MQSCGVKSPKHTQDAGRHGRLRQAPICACVAAPSACHWVFTALLLSRTPAGILAQDDTPPARAPPPPLTFALGARAASSSSPASAKSNARRASVSAPPRVVTAQSARPRTRRRCPP
ncbi:hypothetical protein FB451DRAFT_1378172 [Mycena latifolia]|nr:hypothetical protein FB451DRAFT_1378172 [Mycena latifolia]